MLRLALALLLLGLRPALAVPDCIARLDAMAPKIDAIEDATRKRLAQYDVKRGHTELAEGDEGECIEAADHLQALLDDRE